MGAGAGGGRLVVGARYAPRDSNGRLAHRLFNYRLLLPFPGSVSQMFVFQKAKKTKKNKSEASSEWGGAVLGEIPCSARAMFDLSVPHCCSARTSVFRLDDSGTGRLLNKWMELLPVRTHT